MTIMKMSAGLDTGDILSERMTTLGPMKPPPACMTVWRCWALNCLSRVSPALLPGTSRANCKMRLWPTHARKITKEDGHLYWSQWPTFRRRPRKLPELR